jgi:hypothetical protein
MNKAIILLSVFLAFAFTTADAKDSWQILINKQVIFKGNSDDESPTVSVKVRVLKKTDCIAINYNMDDPDKGWKRTFYISDSNDENLKTAEINTQAGSVSFNASVIKDLMNKKQPVFIYTTSLPKNKELAARIRVRRVLLCKIEWS